MSITTVRMLRSQPPSGGSTLQDALLFKIGGQRGSIRYPSPAAGVDATPRGRSRPSQSPDEVAKGCVRSAAWRATVLRNSASLSIQRHLKPVIRKVLQRPI